jgi:hypothetical protein
MPDTASAALKRAVALNGPIDDLIIQKANQISTKFSVPLGRRRSRIGKILRRDHQGKSFRMKDEIDE